jgi:hypothetical protein
VFKKNTAPQTETERYLNSMHRLGRWGTLGAIVVMLGMPTVLGLYFHSLPEASQVLRAALPLLIVFVPSNLFEVISYTPILGSSIYLALITGEMINLKLPVAGNALKTMNVESSTEEADVVSALAIGAASLLTMTIIAAGVLLAIPIKPVLNLPAVRTASANLLPAVIGALVINYLLTNDLGGGIQARGRFKGLIFPVIALLLLTFFDAPISVFLHLDRLVGQEGGGVIMTVLQGFVVLLILPLTYFGTKWLYKRHKIKVYLSGDAFRK